MLKVLIIDDSEDDRIAIRHALRNQACTVESASSVPKGLVAAELFKPDIILLDYSMQGSNGIEFITRLREICGSAMPALVMITGVGNELVAIQALRAGAFDYLIKDVESHYLKLLPAILERVKHARNARRQAQETERQLQLAANVCAHINEGILVTSPENVIVSVNPALSSITGYAPEELIGASPRIFKSNRHTPEFYQELWRQLLHDGQWRGEIWNRRKDGSSYLAHETITAILDSEGRRLNYLSVMTDITDRKSHENALQKRAYHDELTGLPNRSLFLDRLHHRIAYAERYKNQLAILFIDLDGFKPINDDLGHDTGDELLKAVAGRLLECVRESDTVARWGGDEFTVLLNDLDGRNSAPLVARKILDQLSTAFTVGVYQVKISASIGMAIYPEDETDVQGLIRAADSAMYAAKKSGKAQFRLATEGAPPTATG